MNDKFPFLFLEAFPNIIEWVLPLFHELVEVLLHVFKDKVKGVILADNLQRTGFLGQIIALFTSFNLITLAWESFFRLFTSLRFIASSQE